MSGNTTKLQGPALVYVGFYFHYLADETIRLREGGMSTDEVLQQEDQILEAARVDARARMREMGYTRQVVRQAERDAEKHLAAVMKGARP